MLIHYLKFGFSGSVALSGLLGARTSLLHGGTFGCDIK